LTVMEKTSAEAHSEFMVTRDLLLDHIPARYEKGLARCIETLKRQIHPACSIEPLQPYSPVGIRDALEGPKIETLLTPKEPPLAVDDQRETRDHPCGGQDGTTDLEGSDERALDLAQQHADTKALELQEELHGNIIAIIPNEKKRE
jgi:hypothetical protein